MALLPSDIPTGLVTGEFHFVNEDSVDFDTDPDLLVVTGTVTFTASVPKLTHATKAATIIPMTFDAEFNSNGLLVPKGRLTEPGIELPATNSSLLSPLNYTWKVEFNLKEAATGFSVVIPSFDISVPWGGTVDLTTASPVDTSPGVLTVQGPQGIQGPAGPAGPSGDAAYVQQIPRIASYLKREEKLQDYQTKLANAANVQCNIVAMGDSITEGTGASNVVNRWQTIMQTELRYRHGALTGATFPWIPTWPRTSAPGMPVTRSGNVGVDVNRGIGWKAGIINTDGAVTFTFTGTSFKLIVLKGSTTGVMDVSIDGGAVQSYNTNSITGGGSDAAYKWDSGPLTRGTHTARVTWNASSPANYGIYLFGCLTYDGDETNGIRVLDGGYHGSNSSMYTSAQLTQLGANINSVGNVGLVISAVGTNDYGQSTPIATFKERLELFVSTLRSTGYTGSIAFCGVYKGLTSGVARDDALWTSYLDQMRQVAATDSKVAFFDWRLRMPDVPEPYNASASLGLYADGLHPSDAGHKYIAGFMTDYLSDRYI
ncbi:minor tail protein [Arthrobacter phage Anansi]|uniref:Minor tail protein n=3 Tax=Amigovirus amigo TaxID=1982100 RepID=A0A0U4IIB9_9CAUD|nr:minor tail protein [Arthrobacter phage Anansi]ALY09077.1 minor tail protein [Arthrobacter phage Gorgeous]ALY10358.1 minor tail protein [Arthrobacter phage SorJuana]